MIVNENNEDNTAAGATEQIQYDDDDTTNRCYDVDDQAIIAVADLDETQQNSLEAVDRWKIFIWGLESFIGKRLNIMMWKLKYLSKLFEKFEKT